MAENLFVYVEGNDDELLLNAIIKKCYKKYNFHIYQSSQMPLSKISDLLKCHDSDGDLYAVFTDLDNFESISARRKERSNRLGIGKNHIVVVDVMIESWYVAGSLVKSINDQMIGRRTEEINKTKFDELVGGKFHHRKMMNVIIRNFDVEQAAQRNKSFKDFYRNFKAILDDANT